MERKRKKKKENRRSVARVVVGGPGAVTARGRARTERIKCKGLGAERVDVSTKPKGVTCSREHGRSHGWKGISSVHAKMSGA